MSCSRIPAPALDSEHPGYSRPAHWSASSWTSCFLPHFREVPMTHFHLTAGVEDPCPTSSVSFSPTCIYCSNKELAVGSCSRPGCPGPEPGSLYPSPRAALVVVDPRLPSPQSPLAVLGTGSCWERLHGVLVPARRNGTQIPMHAREYLCGSDKHWLPIALLP